MPGIEALLGVGGPEPQLAIANVSHVDHAVGITVPYVARTAGSLAVRVSNDYQIGHLHRAIAIRVALEAGDGYPDLVQLVRLQIADIGTHDVCARGAIADVSPLHIPGGRRNAPDWVAGARSSGIRTADHSKVHCGTGHRHIAGSADLCRDLVGAPHWVRIVVDAERVALLQTNG